MTLGAARPRFFFSFSGPLYGASPGPAILPVLGTHPSTNLFTLSPMKLPASLRNLRKEYGFTSDNLYTTTNPKTLKNGKVSSQPTIVFHLEPVTFGVCPSAGSCAALCLNKAGNVLYMKNKLSRRQKRSHAFQYHREDFLQLMVLEAARQWSKGYKGVRLNGTSDVAWEKERVTVTPELSRFVHLSFGVYLPAQEYTMISAMVLIGLKPYDYTKRIDRDFDKARYIGYHLTLSWGGKYDDQIFDVAERYCLNVAAPVYGVKKSEPVPNTIKAPNGEEYETIDGDVTDWRRDDGWTGRSRIVALRLKRTPGQTERKARAFCIV